MSVHWLLTPEWENGMYRMDLDAFREQVKGCKLFILCNPHNPGGVVWTEDELRTVAEICYEEKCWCSLTKFMQT